MSDSRFYTANERRRYKVTPFLIGWAQVQALYNQLLLA